MGVAAVRVGWERGRGRWAAARRSGSGVGRVPPAPLLSCRFLAACLCVQFLVDQVQQVGVTPEAIGLPLPPPLPASLQ